MNDENGLEFLRAHFADDDLARVLKYLCGTTNQNGEILKYDPKSVVFLYRKGSSTVVLVEENPSAEMMAEAVVQLDYDDWHFKDVRHRHVHSLRGIPVIPVVTKYFYMRETYDARGDRHKLTAADRLKMSLQNLECFTEPTADQLLSHVKHIAVTTALKLAEDKRIKDEALAAGDPNNRSPEKVAADPDYIEVASMDDGSTYPASIQYVVRHKPTGNLWSCRYGIRDDDSDYGIGHSWTRVVEKTVAKKVYEPEAK